MKSEFALPDTGQGPTTRCPVCLCVPHVLDAVELSACHHTLCAECLLKYREMEMERNENEDVACPLCRKQSKTAWVRRYLNGAVADAAYEESLHLLSRASWTQNCDAQIYAHDHDVSTSSSEDDGDDGDACVNRSRHHHKDEERHRQIELHLLKGTTQASAICKPTAMKQAVKMQARQGPTEVGKANKYRARKTKKK
uniref:RING-type domain-containing protein n=1 Tax=Palpitomonas bilix TaxID=652834 RepID=A0A7S3D6N8_9EUKA|mmetsp:Transcript_23642/g.59554  ORF Transcript_23642/g.59554 Transcript_23642/m.59554 type:complete len:197 (+) Transcript_23642:148-738(+)